jgi:hypothetical protein
MRELSDYIKDPDNDLNNFYLGLFYENQNHHSPASGFYLRCAEKTSSIDLRYESLLRMYLCYRNLGGRDYTCETLLKQAISLCPRKPEAYFFLTQYYEAKSDWSSIYTYASISLDICEEKSVFFSTIEFPDLYALLFQKAASAWWIGKPLEARKLFKELFNNYLDKMTDKYKTLLENNLSRLGSGPESQAIRPYNKNLKDNLNFTFKGIDLVDHNFSQVYQDMFILTALNGKRNGSYLEIGSSDALKNSNTALLETKFDWTGIGIEFNQDFVNTHKNQRKNPVLCTDALIVNYEKLLTKYFPGQNNIDYLQLDIEPPKNTYEALLSIPFDKYKFAVITYEHDDYIDISRSYKQKSREYLQSLGYILVVNDVSPDQNSSFEDWWAHPDLVDIDIIKGLKSQISEDLNQVERVFLHK